MPLHRSLKNKPAVLYRKLKYTVMLLNNTSHAFCTETMPLFCCYRLTVLKYRLLLIPVAYVNAQFVIPGMNTQPDKALIDFRYPFTGCYGVFQSV